MSGGTAQTFQEPNTTSSETNALAFLFAQLHAQTWTACPVKVLACTSDGELALAGTVDVQPLVNQVDGTGTPTPHGTIFKLQYTRVQGGANAVIIDPQVGDIGWAVFCDRDISSVVANRGQANPGSWRRNAASDGIYTGGILNVVPTQFIQFNSDGITITSTATVTINGDDVVVNASSSAQVNSPSVSLGGEGGMGVARIGDQVNSSTFKIETGSSVTTST